MMMQISDEVGIIGVIFILISYILLQLEKIDSKSITYSIINLIGAVLILFSLFYSWNLASVIIEIFLILISIFGIVKHFFVKRK